MKHTYKKTEDKNYVVTLETGEIFNCVVAVDESEIEELVQCYLDSKNPPVYAAPTYKELRAAEYPSIVDQLDKIYHTGIDGWKSDIQVVKDKYPKP